MFSFIQSRFFHSVDSLTKGLQRTLSHLDAVAEREYATADAKRAAAADTLRQAKGHEDHASKAERIAARIESLLK